MDKKLDLCRFWGFSGRGLIFLLKTTFFLRERLDLGRFWDFSGRDPIFPLKTTFFLDKKLDPGKIKQNQAKPGKMKQNQGKTSKLKQNQVQRGAASGGGPCGSEFSLFGLGCEEWKRRLNYIFQIGAESSKMEQNEAESSKIKQNEAKPRKNKQKQPTWGATRGGTLVPWNLACLAFVVTNENDV